ncbi:hypothetical protein LZQ00_07960 [Sphingobacterium sp. SRCM116780]|uniref:hypothetical protein n=1 Tax=Sphingobacterium sp. SRCM116780 TaxID=2907623 RepID=UPI001F182ED4|nr:hypothetical protein [Sphingobacterium sp. SRCM116780]UIR57746.1 hypothetical protein LZQ00_07960 [Sphingobacterium sp. SRCM116780]
MKNFRHIVRIFTVFVISYLIYYNFQLSKKEIAKSNRLLHNNVAFEGIIVRIQRSNNHAFGIIELKLIKCNVNDFYKSIVHNEFKGIYPYRIKNDLAELYTTISNDIKVDDSVKVVSNDLTIYYNLQKGYEEGSLYMISEGSDLNYVRENTTFK